MEQKVLLNALYRFACNIASDCDIKNCQKAARRLAGTVKRLLKERQELEKVSKSSGNKQS